MKSPADVIICAHNNRDIIARCLDSVNRQTVKPATITVIDDYSTDGTPELVRKKYPTVRIIRKKSNVGPSRCRNDAINSTKSCYIAILDSDVVLDKSWLKEMLAVMDKDWTVAMAGSKLLCAKDKNRINSTGISLMRIGVGRDRDSGKPATFDNNETRILAVCSAAMIIRRTSLAKIGLFDEAFFYGQEDTDLCWRANIAGFGVVYNPKAVAHHNVSETVSKNIGMVYFHATKNRIRLLVSNYQLRNLILYLALYTIVSIGDIIFRPYRREKLAGWLWNISNFRATMQKRKLVQALRNKKDSELFPLF